MKVRTIMSASPITVARSASVDRAMETMDAHEIRHLPVVDHGDLVGVISDRDLLDATGWLYPTQRRVLEAPEGSVGEFMTHPARAVAAEEELDAALAILTADHIGCLPVVEEARLVGVITEVDVLRTYVDACRIGRVAPAQDPPLRSCATLDPLTLTPDQSGSEAEAILREEGVRHLPVVLGDRLVGIVSDRDVRLERGRGRLELTSVEEMMSRDPQTLAPDARLSSAALLMSCERISALPLTDDGRLIGITTVADITPACAEVLQSLG